MNIPSKIVLFILVVAGGIPAIIGVIMGSIVIILSIALMGPAVLFLYLQGLKATTEFLNSLNMEEWSKKWILKNGKWTEDKDV